MGSGSGMRIGHGARHEAVDERMKAALAGALVAAVIASAAHGPKPDDLAARPAAPTHCDDLTPTPGATLLPSRDLYCLFLTPRYGLEYMSGHLELRTPHTPFGVAVNAAGHHLYEGILTLGGLPEPSALGDFDHIVAWLASPIFDTIIPLGPVANGTRSIGEITLNKFMIIITAEERPDAPEWEGRLLLRASSPSSRMSPPDMQEFMLGALGTEPGDTGTAPGLRMPGDQRMPGMPPDSAGGGAAMGDHAHMPNATPTPWPHPPMLPGLTMFPALMALAPPTATPFLPGPAAAPTPPTPPTLPLARPRDILHLGDGDTIALEAGLVRRRIRSRDHIMYGFNGQYPGPLLHVPEAATVTVDFTNSIPWPTTIHWHGLRLDNASDGVPGVTQDPVEPGETFRYTVHFRDPGVYWYHPHHREDILKDLGLYGNMLVEPRQPDYYAPADREEFLMLDDFLMAGDEPMPFGRERTTHAFMGRFGNLFLVNGEPDYELEVSAGEVVRLYMTNVSNTRTFNLSFEGAAGREDDGAARSGAAVPTHRIKVIGTDIGAFEREEWVESIVLSPAERYIVHVRFDEPGEYTLLNRIQGIDHLGGVFFPETDTLGVVRAAPGTEGTETFGSPAAADNNSPAVNPPATAARSPAARNSPSAAFDTLRTNLHAAREIALYRDQFDLPIDRELTFTLETTGAPYIVERLMQFDSAYFHPVEWSGTMPMMNWNSTSEEVRWIVRDPATGAENMDIEWEFEVGDIVRIRMHNERRSFHAMQHPFHIHGQRFLVLARNGVPNENLAWKDTVLLPAGTTTDILLEITNPGRWMAHCHISEHLEAGMRMLFTVNP